MTSNQFCLPKRLLAEREYGRRDDRIKRQQANVLERNKETGEFQTRRLLPAESIYGPAEEQEEETEPYDNVLTVVGILPHQLGLVRAWFRKRGVEPQFDPPIDEGHSTASISSKLRGNWAYVLLEDPVVSYDFITPTIQLDDRVIVSCFVGYFQSGRCYPVPARDDRTRSRDGMWRAKDSWKNRNWVDLPMEEKSFLNKIREFFLGTREIPADKRTVKKIVQGWIKKTGIPDFWEKYIMEPLFD